MIQIKNKKGMEKIYSIWWFAFLAVVGAGILIGVVMFYGADVDMRKTEAEILYNNLFDCLIGEKGFLEEEFFIGASNQQIFQRCNLDESSFGKDSNWYFNISFYDLEKNVFKESISFGNPNFEIECIVQEKDSSGKKIKAVHYPKCVHEKREVYYFDYEKGIQKIYLDILTGSNQELKTEK